MSDSHIYELEDIVWDDFLISNDHIIPYPEIQHDEGSAMQAECHKKFKHKAGMTNNTGCHEAELVGVATGEKKKLSPNIPTVTRGDLISNNNFFIGASNHVDNCTASENNSFYPLSDTPRSESDLSFLCNDHENKDPVNSMFYEWQDIGNYDLTQMLRSCDSSFGLGDLAKEDDTCWFSSSTAINGPNANALSQVRPSYSDFNSLKIFSQNCESSQPTNESPTVDALKKRSAGASYTSGTLASNITGQSCLSKASSFSELSENLVKMGEKKPFKEVKMHARNKDYQKQSMETNVSPHQFDSSKLTLKTLSIGKASNKSLFPNSTGLQKQNESLKSSQSSEHALEETSFLQLQEVLEQMDLKTKLCIRDSLYRLAWSAEQRHGIATMNRAGTADKNSNEAITAGTKHAGVLDNETDTNPLDRSIAHLLFHRPSDPSKMLLLSKLRPGHKSDGAEMFRHDGFTTAGFQVSKKE